AIPQSLLIIAPHETLEVDSPNHITRLHEIQRRKWNLDSRRPALGRYPGLRRPNAIPARVSVSLVAAAILQPLLVRNEAVSLGSQRIGLKHVGVTPVVRRVDHDLKIVIELLTNVPAQLGSYNLSGFRVIADDSEKHRISRVENAYFRPLCRGLSFIGLSLSEVGNGLGQFPLRIIDSAVDFWRMIHSHCIRNAKCLRHYSCLRLTPKSSSRQGASNNRHIAVCANRIRLGTGFNEPQPRKQPCAQRLCRLPPAPARKRG